MLLYSISSRLTMCMSLLKIKLSSTKTQQEKQFSQLSKAIMQLYWPMVKQEQAKHSQWKASILIPKRAPK